MNKKKELWLLISAFGIMFAVLSWLQESAILKNGFGYCVGKASKTLSS